MFKIIICEDEEIQRKIMFEYIEIFFKKDIEYEIICFNNGEELINNYIKADIIFMDIGLKGMNGLEAAKEIRKIDKDVVIIFATAFVSYATEGYDVRAFSYLLKPITYNSFEKIMSKYFIERSEEKKLIEFKIKDETKVIKLEEIICIESLGKYVKIHTKTESFFTAIKIKRIEEKLSSKIFFRCHKSFLINLLEVRNYNRKEVILGDRKIKATISYRKYNNFKKSLTSFLCDRF